SRRRHTRSTRDWSSDVCSSDLRMMKGPYDTATKAAWDRLLGDLKDFNKSVIITPGNAGTLDMLNRGEIAIGPVWVDMFYTWMAEIGRASCRERIKSVAVG